jgi:stage II sporulation protein P
MQKMKKFEKIFMISLLSTFILFSYFGGSNFQRLREILGKDKDVKFYRNIVESTYPVFGVAFNSGSSKFSLFEELNHLGRIFYGVDLGDPISFVESNIPLMYSYYKKIGIQDTNFEHIGFEDEDYITNHSSISYQPEHDVEDAISKNLGKIKFIKEAGVDFEIEDLLSVEPALLRNEAKGPGVFVYHTHTTEDYTVPSNSTSTGRGSGSGTVVDVGDVLSKELSKKFGVEVIHNAKDHTRPQYSTSYARSLETAISVLKSYPSIDIVLDIHRDALANVDKFAPTLEVGDKSVAQVMIVVGTNTSGREHPNWKKNLAFAVRLQEKLEEACPGITRPILISRNRYNQHISDFALILEMGGNGNTLEQATESAKYVAQALGNLIN